MHTTADEANAARDGQNQKLMLPLAFDPPHIPAAVPLDGEP